MAFKRTKKRTTGTWSRKGKPKRSKEIWHFPKRASLYQMKGFVQILQDLKFHGKPWTKGKKETFNTELAKRGYTESGSPLSPSGLRTFEALVKYVGFIYVDTFVNPPIIYITDAGVKLLENPVKAFKEQMLKLQITNPVILKDCININLFPFRTTLKLLLEFGFLTYEEIAYLLIAKMKKQIDFDHIMEELQKFRGIPIRKKTKILQTFLRTPEGNIALGQAPTAVYFASLCIGTELCERDSKKKILKIKDDKEQEIKNLLKQFEGIDPYDFGDNLPLWIEYYGNPNRLFPPKDIAIKVLEET